jgi:obg-like ATPase 1
LQVRGAAEGAGLGNAFLSNIQSVDGIFHVVRAFESEEVIHVDDTVDPIRDLETIQLELSKKDLNFVEAADAKETKDVKCTPGSKLSLTFTDTIKKCKELLVVARHPLPFTKLNFGSGSQHPRARWGLFDTRGYSVCIHIA